MTELPPEVDDAFVELLRECVAEILRHEDYGRFVVWLRGTAFPEHAGALPPVDAGGAAALAPMLGRAIWNSTPLPGNGYRPRPVAEPGRNDACPCGSGRKYKQCCASMPQFPPIAAEEIWAVVADVMPEGQLDRAIAERHVPQSALVYVAHRFLEDGKPRRAVTVLEPLFGVGLPKLDERFEEHLDLLCDAYTELGNNGKKAALLDRVTREGTRDLACAAWQRLAVVRMDEGEDAAAWDAFREAQRAEPRHPALGVLEVTLLMARGNSEMAAERAKFWAAQFRRRDDVAPQTLEFLESVAADPAGAFESAGPVDTGRVSAWLKSVADRPLPAYAPAELEAIDPSDTEALSEAIARQLEAMGLPAARARSEARAQAKRFAKEEAKRAADAAQGRLFDDAQAGPGGPDTGGRTPVVLQAPEAIAELESRWRDVFPGGKPFSVTLDCPDGEIVWEDDAAERWVGFLESNPACFDSLDILDDLVAALEYIEPPFLAQAGRTAADAVTERGCAILSAAVGEGDPLLEWAAHENRPALRLLARQIGRMQARRDEEGAMRLADLALRLNPEDNHGHRGTLMNHRLARGDDDGALALAARYPDDVSPEIAFGRVLGLYRKGEGDAALRELAEAGKYLPHVAHYLCEATVRRPKSEEFGIIAGGDEEAWYYREAMRETWAATSGALDWLKQEAPPPPAPAKGKPGGRAAAHRGKR